MDRVGARDLGGGDDSRDVEIAIRSRGGGPMQIASSASRTCIASAVGGRMHRDRLDPHFVAGAVDAQRDLAAIGDQELLDFGTCLLDDDERLVEFDRLAVLDQDRGDRAGARRGDRVHHLHRLDDQQRVAGRDLLRRP